MIADLFPRGWQHYLYGGLLVGLGTGLIFLVTGIRAGASGFFSTVQSYFSNRACFQVGWVVRERGWRTALTLGLLAGAVVYTVAFAHEPFVTRVQWWRLALGGVLVGYGTRLSRGCTSGHGICGLSGGARSSLVAVLTFMGVAMATAWLVGLTGVTP